MKFKIVHESRGRVRIRDAKTDDLEQADLLEAYLNHSPRHSAGGGT